MEKTTRLLAQSLVDQLADKDVLSTFEDPQEVHRIKEIRRALCVMLSINSPDRHVWEAAARLKEIFQC